MPAAASSSLPALAVEIRCEGFPAGGFDGFESRRAIRVDLQTKDGYQPGKIQKDGGISFATEILVKQSGSDGAIDFTGPAVHGKRGERFFYLSWSGEKSGHREMFRRIKVHLRDLNPAQIAKARRSQGTLIARVHAVAKDGGPACASVPLLGGAWSVC